MFLAVPYSVPICLLIRLIFAAVGGLPRHVAWIEMKLSRLLLARLLLVWILVVSHGSTPVNVNTLLPPGTLDNASNEDIVQWNAVEVLSLIQ
jgi:hypothetical protein